MVSNLVSVVFISVCATISANSNDYHPPSVAKPTNEDSSQRLPIEDHIKGFGYPVESHYITTDDGYILNYHRIPHGKIPTPNIHRPPVLVQHGLLAASPVWALSADSLAFSLADANLDVWLGNARGNTYSRKHIKYDPDKHKAEFWDFSWHEMGYYDMPASIDYILNLTNVTKLFYIGHSMGTTMYFVLGATRPEYMDKITAMVAMSPAASLWNVRSPLATFCSDLYGVFLGMAQILKIYELLPHSSYHIPGMGYNLCEKPQNYKTCNDLYDNIGGFTDKEKRKPIPPIVHQYVPAGASTKQIRHFRQICFKGSHFGEYDYGILGNLKRYGTAKSPLYNMTNIKSPIYIYFGQSDWLTVPQDVEYTVHHLPNVQRVTKVSEEEFNHMDFMWDDEAKSLVYNDVVSLITNYQDN